MITTYTVAPYSESDKNVEVTYYNDEGFVHKRQVNLPHLPNGFIDQEYFQEVLEAQLRGVNAKLSLGVITFVDPNVGIGTSA